MEFERQVFTNHIKTTFVNLWIFCLEEYNPLLYNMINYLIPIGMREGTFHPLYFWDQILFIKNFQTFLKVKININQVDLTPCQAHYVF